MPRNRKHEGRRRFGHIRRKVLKNGEERFYVRYTGPDGQDRNGPHAFLSWADADRYLNQIELQMRGDNWADPNVPRVTFGEYAKAWLKDKAKTLKPSTIQQYGDTLRVHILPTFQRVPADKIKPADVRGWYGDLETGDRARAAAYSLLRNILNTAVSDGLYDANPCMIKGAGSYGAPERPYLSRAQAEAMAKAMPTPDLTAFVLVSLWAHLRLGEALAIRRRDVDLAAGKITVRRSLSELRGQGQVETTTKTKRIRTVHVPSQGLAVLRAHMDATGPALPDARLFTHRTGKPLTKAHVERAWNKARGAQGMKEYHVHDLRHAGLTYAAQRGATPKELMALGGHKSPRAAMIYQHAAEERMQALAVLMSDEPTTADDQADQQA